jgi:hypothetical protein
MQQVEHHQVHMMVVVPVVKAIQVDQIMVMMEHRAQVEAPVDMQA